MTNKYRLYAFICVLLTVFLLVTQLVIADENGSKEEQTKDKVVEQTKPYKSKRSRIKTLEEFIPSEEVSADKPVAFPSDI